MGNVAEYRYAGFWIRLLASLIDVVLITAILFPLLFAIYGTAYFQVDAMQSALSGETFEPGPIIRGPADFLITYVVPALAAIIFWRYKSATPGKMLFSIRIVDALTGDAPSFAQCIIRYFAYLVSMLPLGLGFLWIAFDKRKQAWHDKLAGTIVVRSSYGK